MRLLDNYEALPASAKVLWILIPFLYLAQELLGVATRKWTERQCFRHYQQTGRCLLCDMKEQHPANKFEDHRCYKEGPPC